MGFWNNRFNKINELSEYYKNENAFITYTFIIYFTLKEYNYYCVCIWYSKSYTFKSIIFKIIK